MIVDVTLHRTGQSWVLPPIEEYFSGDPPRLERSREAAADVHRAHQTVGRRRARRCHRSRGSPGQAVEDLHKHDEASATDDRGSEFAQRFVDRAVVPGKVFADGVCFDRRSSVVAEFGGAMEGVADARDFEFTGGELAGGLCVGSGIHQAALMTGEHAPEDRDGTLLRLRVGAAETDKSFGAVVAGRERTHVGAHVAHRAARRERRPLLRGRCPAGLDAVNEGKGVRNA
jgi:hypothetical protein